jgi:hypothetical protein
VNILTPWKTGSFKTFCPASHPRLVSPPARFFATGEPYETMRLSESEALERAAGMVDQLHRSYLRTLKAL